MNVDQFYSEPEADEETSEEIYQFVRQLSDMRVRKGTIKRAVRERFPETRGTGFRQIERQLKRAREERLKEAGKTVHEFRAESVAFYDAVAGDPKASHKDRIAARKAADDLVGAKKPKRIEVATVELTEQELEAEERRLGIHEGNGRPVDSGRFR